LFEEEEFEEEEFEEEEEEEVFVFVVDVSSVPVSSVSSSEDSSQGRMLDPMTPDAEVATAPCFPIHFLLIIRQILVK
jgi:hypothetical protein